MELLEAVQGAAVVQLCERTCALGWLSVVIPDSPRLLDGPGSSGLTKLTVDGCFPWSAVIVSIWVEEICSSSREYNCSFCLLHSLFQM